ncbi:MAG: esterase-like activity of phytase family protein [Aliishimia sp.]
MLQRIAFAVTCALTCLAMPASADLVVASRMVVSDAQLDIGGLSAIEVSADGKSIHVLSDRGTYYAGVVQRDTNGKLTELEITQTLRLRHDGEHKHPDSEGLVIGDDGAIIVSAEGPSRLLRYQLGNKFPKYLKALPPGIDLVENRGFEALAQDKSGAFYTFFESPDTDTNTFPMYRFKDGAWDVPRHIEALGKFSIVGADFAPDGRLFLLERGFSPLGFRTRIRYFDVNDAKTEPTTVFTSRLGEFDNLEGIALWQDAAGDIRITTVSDDNFMHIWRSEIVEFILKE